MTFSKIPVNWFWQFTSKGSCNITTKLLCELEMNITGMIT